MVNIVRWEVIGGFYSRLDSTEDKSTVKADVARWIGLGELYQEMPKVSEGQ